MTSGTETQPQLPSGKPIVREQVDYDSLWWLAFGAAFIAAIFNTVIFMLMEQDGVFTNDVIVSVFDAPMSAGWIALASFIGVIAGAGVYAVLGQAVDTPVLLFQVIAGAVLVMSFALPFTIDGASDGYILVLNLMHFTTFVACIVATSIFAVKRETSTEV